MITQVAAEIGPLWEIVKGVLLFVITGCVGFLAKVAWSARHMVLDHERAIYGRNGTNGLIRGQKDLVDRVGVIEDRNIAIDAVAKAELEGYAGEERRHDPIRRLADMIRRELQQERDP